MVIPATFPQGKAIFCIAGSNPKFQDYTPSVMAYAMTAPPTQESLWPAQKQKHPSPCGGYFWAAKPSLLEKFPQGGLRISLLVLTYSVRPFPSAHPGG